jgi:hypothetical protein
MVILVNCFTTHKEVTDFHSQVKDPDDYGILCMHGRDGSNLYTLVSKSALKELEEG